MSTNNIDNTTLKPIRHILLVDDDQSLWSLIVRQFSKTNIKVSAVKNAAMAHEIIGQQIFDALLLDYCLGNDCGIKLVEQYAQFLPCILITAQGSEEVAVNAMKSGALDYVVKDSHCHFLKILPEVTLNALNRFDLKLKLQRTQKRMRTIFDEAQDLMLVTNTHYDVIEVSKTAAKIYATELNDSPNNLLNYFGQSLLEQIVRNEFQDIPVLIPLKQREIPFQIYYQQLNENECLFVFRNQSILFQAEEKVREVERIQLENKELLLKNKLLAKHKHIETSRIIGLSKPIQELKQTIANVADTDANILINGETGTGKELVANEIHTQSQRCNGPLIKLNCGAIPENLVESELFGHVKGAFTGAIKDRKGKFEQANGGTLFLDEIGELSLNVQVKLLRVLQENQLEPVGGSKIIDVDVRIVAATHKNLAQMVLDGLFRADLFYRLNVIPLSVPSLRDRREDISLLANYFLEQYRSSYSRSITPLSETQMEFLRSQQWTGNIRELRNTLERWVVLGQLQTDETFPDTASLQKSTSTVQATGAQSNNRQQAPCQQTSLEDVERQHIIKILNLCHWKISGPNGAARILDLNPSTLRFRMKKLNIERQG